MGKRDRTKKIVLSAVFVALITAGAFIKIPTPLVPITMQFCFTLLAGLLLGGNLGAISVAVYIIMGLCGVPIFAGGGGFSYVLSPTFGYMLGFVAGSFAAGKISRLIKGKKPPFWLILVASLTALVIVYALGATYMYLILKLYLGKNTTFGAALMSGVVIFIPTDVTWCILASLLAYRIIPVVSPWSIKARNGGKVDNEKN